MEKMDIIPIVEVLAGSPVMEDTPIHAFLMDSGSIVVHGFTQGDNVIIPVGNRIAKFDHLTLESLDVIQQWKADWYYIQFTGDSSFVSSKPFQIVPIPLEKQLTRLKNDPVMFKKDYEANVQFQLV